MAINCQNEPGGKLADGTSEDDVGTGADAAGTLSAGAALGSRAACVDGCGDPSAAGCEAWSAGCTRGGAGTGEAGMGRESEAEVTGDADPASDASFAERGEFCPTTYPIAKATANNRTTMKNPLNSCRLPTTSSNSPVSLFLMV
jgi:hypothetical protein